MTIGITVSVNGNYKVPVKVKHQDGTLLETVVSGKGNNNPVVYNVPFYHGDKSIIEITVGPEEQDND